MADSMFGLRRRGLGLQSQYQQEASGVAGLNRRAPMVRNSREPFQELYGRMRQSAMERGLRSARMEDVRANYAAVQADNELAYRRQKDQEDRIRSYAEMGLQRENNRALRALTARGQNMDFGLGQQRIGLDRDRLATDRDQFGRTFAEGQNRFGAEFGEKQYQFDEQQKRLREQGAGRGLSGNVPSLDQLTDRLIDSDPDKYEADPLAAYREAARMRGELMGEADSRPKHGLMGGLGLLGRGVAALLPNLGLPDQPAGQQDDAPPRGLSRPAYQPYAPPQDAQPQHTPATYGLDAQGRPMIRYAPTTRMQRMIAEPAAMDANQARRAVGLMQSTNPLARQVGLSSLQEFQRQQSSQRTRGLSAPSAPATREAAPGDRGYGVPGPADTTVPTELAAFDQRAILVSAVRQKYPNAPEADIAALVDEFLAGGN